MSILTNFLKLFKYDVNTDGASTFNINKGLNENWDKIDTALQEVSQQASDSAPTDSPAFTGTPTAPTPTTDNGIANKSYVDGKYDELFQSVSSGKQLVATAITDKGVPTVATDTFQTMATNISEIKSSGSRAGNGVGQVSTFELFLVGNFSPNYSR